MPPAAFDLVRAPTALPLDLIEAKAHLRVTNTTDDALITGLIRAAVTEAEAFQGRQLVLAQWDYFLPAFPAVIVPPLGPVRSIDSVAYIDDQGAAQTMAAGDYQTNLKTSRSRIRPAWGKSWPSIRLDENAVTVRFTAGYVTKMASVNIGSDTITATNHPYANGDVLRLSNSGGVLPAPLSADTDYYAVGVSGNDLQLSATSGGGAIVLIDGGTGTSFLGRVPADTIHALKLLISHYHENTEAVMPQNLVTLPLGVHALLMHDAIMRAA